MIQNIKVNRSLENRGVFLNETSEKLLVKKKDYLIFLLHNKMAVLSFKKMSSYHNL